MRYLVTSIGSLAAEAVIKSIQHNKFGDVIGCNVYPKKWTAASRFIEIFYEVPHSLDKDKYINQIKKICNEQKITHIIPLTDIEIDVFSENYNYFKDHGIILCIPSIEAIKISRNKLAIYEYFKEKEFVNAIPTKNIDEYDKEFFRYPLLAKPRNGRSSEGHINIEDQESLYFWRKKLLFKNYIVQPKLLGEVYTVDLVCDTKHDRYVAITRKELVRTINGAGITVLIQPDHPCSQLAIKVAKSIGIRGCINIEFLVSNESPMLMDINPRFSAGVGFSQLAGYDMVAHHLHCFNSQSIELPKNIKNEIYTRSYTEYKIEG